MWRGHPEKFSHCAHNRLSIYVFLLIPFKINLGYFNRKIQKAMHSMLQEWCRWPFKNVFTGQQALFPSCCQWWVNSLYQLRSPGTCPGLIGASLLRCLRRLPNLHHYRQSHVFPSIPNMWSVADWHEDPRAWPFTLTVRSDAVHWYLNYKLSPKSGQ